MKIKEARSMKLLAIVLLVALTGRARADLPAEASLEGALILARTAQSDFGVHHRKPKETSTRNQSETELAGLCGGENSPTTGRCRNAVIHSDYFHVPGCLRSWGSLTYCVLLGRDSEIGLAGGFMRVEVDDTVGVRLDDRGEREWIYTGRVRLRDGRMIEKVLPWEPAMSESDQRLLKD